MRRCIRVLRIREDLLHQQVILLNTLDWFYQQIAQLENVMRALTLHPDHYNCYHREHARTIKRQQLHSTVYKVCVCVFVYEGRGVKTKRE